MSSAGFALQQAIFAQLSNDPATTAALGGTRIYDDVPPRAEFPFVTFGISSERDWSTGTDQGFEHAVSLHVWSRGHGRKEAEAIVSAVREALHDHSLALTGHRL